MITSSAIADLQARFRGELLAPGDEGYDAARLVFNAMVDRRPALVARCTDAADVAEALAFARDHGLLVSVRCTGHNIGGFAVCDGGLVIDLSRMKDIAVDVGQATVRVGAGCNWGEVNDALQPHGLAVPGGFVSVTGVSGLTLGGGLGWLVRKYGLSLDNLLSADVVLANGTFVTASGSEHDDLFWAIRGGGGNFGIVTSFQFRAHSVGTLLAGIVLHPAARAAEALRYWRDYDAASPEETALGALLFHFPDDPSGPPPLRGQPLVGLGGVYVGPVADGETLLQPLRGYGPPLVDLFRPTPYNEAQRMADFLWPPGLRGYWKSGYLRAMSDGAIDVIAEHFARVPSKRTVVVLEHNGGGAMDRVAEPATAFGDRGWPYNFVVTSAWSDPAETERNIAWTRELFAAMQPFLATGVYVNYLGDDEGADRLHAAYGTAKLARLASLKMKYDPGNV
ncbi:MAG: FAD-binding oxidoreductase, partial [Burkholderiales bacterium]